MSVHWRTRPTASGWEAQCVSGVAGGITPCWLVRGATEQAALDSAVGIAVHYWVEWERFLPGDEVPFGE